MSTDNDAQSIVERKPRMVRRARRILKLAVAAGGIITFAACATPARISGAGRTVKIKWHQRKQEVHVTIRTKPTALEFSNGSRL